MNNGNDFDFDREMEARIAGHRALGLAFCVSLATIAGTCILLAALT
jgi:hypothetical protein